MSLPKQSIHLRLTPEMHEKLRLMAGVQGKNMTEHGELLLEKMIVAGTTHLVCNLSECSAWD